MAKLVDTLRPWALALSLSIGAVGCHADPDDAAGQAQELADPVRREHALGNLKRLYGAALSSSKSDRNAPEVKALTDATVQPLVKTYLDYPEDTRAAEQIVMLLQEMRDPRSLPALLKALRVAERSQRRARHHGGAHAGGD